MITCHRTDLAARSCHALVLRPVRRFDEHKAFKINKTNAQELLWAAAVDAGQVAALQLLQQHCCRKMPLCTLRVFDPHLVHHNSFGEHSAALSPTPSGAECCQPEQA